jgi:hypothetical protein
MGVAQKIRFVRVVMVKKYVVLKGKNAEMVLANVLRDRRCVQRMEQHNSVVLKIRSVIMR